MPAATVPLMVAIYDNPGIKHWSLYIDIEDKENKTIIHVLGARQRYFHNVRTPSDPRTSKSCVELCALCHIDVAQIERVKNIGWTANIRNEESDYSCQDFVLDLLEVLEDRGIIDRDNESYMKNKAAIIEKRESWQ